VSDDGPLAEFEIGSGAQRGSRLTLYANRLLHQGTDSMEAVPLAQLAAVRVAFERDPAKMNWAIALLVLALFCAAISGPLQAWLGGAAARIGEPARRESLDAVLQGVFGAMGAVASMLPALAAALAAGAAVLLVYFWLGVTVLTLAFAAAERSYPVRGRNRHLLEFAQTVAEQLARRKD
jgi:hypothetical protein